MPGMKGTEMYQKIRSIRQEQPFILSTGFSETVTRESALAMGIRELIMKPYLKEELAVVVRNVLDHPGENTDTGNREMAAGQTPEPVRPERLTGHFLSAR